MIRELRAADPESIGRYRLLGRLGTGGMGMVYMAKSPGDRLVAIKVIRPELADERGFRIRFATEIAVARNVSGVYTAAVVDADPDADPPWLATAYVPGPSLADAVDDGGPLPVRSVLSLAAGLAEALQAIHAAGVVHRDLKPSNVLLAADGPRVIDFGISRAWERSRLTTTGTVMGSPGFLSPEQATGQEVGPPSDVFSLGAVLAFAATGDSPFGGGPTPALLYRVVNQAPDLSQVPDRLRPVIEPCLAKDPASRPAPGELLGMLSDGPSVLTGQWLPTTLSDTLDRYVPTAASPAVTHDIPVPARTAGPAGPGLDVSATGQAPVAPPSRFRRRWPIAAGIAAGGVVTALVVVLTQSPGKPPGANPGTSSSALRGTTHSPATARPDTAAAAHAVAKPVIIRLTAMQDCWVGITNPAGQALYQGDIPAGATRTWDEKNPVSMVIGNPPGIVLTADGKVVPMNTDQAVTLSVNPSSATPVTVK